MAFSHRKSGNTHIFELTGSLDIYTSVDFKNLVSSSVIPESKDIIIDLEKLNYIDSSGIGMLIKMMNTLKSQNHNFFLTRMKPSMEKVFKVAGLTTYFEFIAEKEFAEKYPN
jgi:anti-sigma B factor antagonist